MTTAGEPVIDFHCHILEHEVYGRSWMHNIASRYGADGRPQPGSRSDGLRRRMLDPATILADMDRYGIDASVLSLSTVISGAQWAEPAVDLEPYILELSNPHTGLGHVIFDRFNAPVSLTPPANAIETHG